MGGRIHHRRPDQVPPRALPGAPLALPPLVRLEPRVPSPAPLPEVAAGAVPGAPAGAGGPGATTPRPAPPPRAGTGAPSPGFPTLLEYPPRPPPAPAPPPRAAVGAGDSSRATRVAATGRRACRGRGSCAEGPVPERRARVVVDGNHVVAARHDGERREQRDAVDGDALHGGLHAPLAFEFGFPLQLEAGLRERVDRDVRIGPQPVRALRVALRGRPFVADVA